MSLESVAIIGGGIGGLASAIFLERVGYRVTVYEKAKGAGPVGAGFLLQPPGQIVLDKLSVLAEVSRSSVPIMGLRSETTSGYTILDLNYGHLEGEPRHGLGVQRSTIYQALYDVASSSERIQFKWDSHVEHLKMEDTHVSVHVNDATDTHDLCILSSGSNSNLAADYFENRIKNSYEWGCLWATIRLPESFSTSMLHQRCFRSEKMMGVLPVNKVDGGYEAALYWSAKVLNLGEVNARNFDAIRREIIAFWPELEAAIESLNYSKFISAVYNDVWLHKPFKGRLIAIGDASHATSPQLGQGCTMALLDALLLAKCLEDKSKPLNETLEYWWSTRKNQLTYIRHLSRFLTPLYQSDNRLYSAFRDMLMAPVGRLPFIYDLQLRTLASEVFLRIP